MTRLIASCTLGGLPINASVDCCLKCKTRIYIYGLVVLSCQLINVIKNKNVVACLFVRTFVTYIGLFVHP